MLVGGVGGGEGRGPRFRRGCGPPGPAGRYADHRGFAALDQRFHDTIATASHRPPLADAVERLHSHLPVLPSRSAGNTADPTSAEHERVVRAARRRGPDRAAEAMTEHLAGSFRRRLGQARTPRPVPADGVRIQMGTGMPAAGRACRAEAGTRVVPEDGYDPSGQERGAR
ncbi:FCD domain-containing protein [Streptomyces sp. NPDC004457]